jgi:hypothetical protein
MDGMDDQCKQCKPAFVGFVDLGLRRGSPSTASPRKCLLIHASSLDRRAFHFPLFSNPRVA